jgi:hypothetical protein
MSINVAKQIMLNFESVEKAKIFMFINHHFKISIINYMFASSKNNLKPPQTDE